MNSEIAICNQALGWLGANQIISFDDASQEAKLCKANYQYLRDAVLEDYAWSFAVKRDSLAPLAETPVTYGYAFQVPSDAIRILQVSVDASFDPTEDVVWEIEDNKILTDNASIYVRYVYRVTDPTKFSPNFKQALAARIAADIAIPLSASRALQSDMYSLYTMKIAEAAQKDGTQGRNKRLRSSWLLSSR